MQLDTFKLFAHQRKILKNYLKNDYNIVSQYRGGGTSTLTCAYLFWKMISNNNFKVGVVGTNIGCVNSLLKIILDFNKYLPKELKLEIADNNSKKITFNNGSEIRLLLTNESLFRDNSFDLLFLDNASFFDVKDTFYDSIRLVSKKIIVTSTPNGKDNLFYPIYEETKNGVGDFKLTEVFWFEDERYNSDLTWQKDDEVIEGKDVIKYNPTSTWYKKTESSYGKNVKTFNQEFNHSFGC